MPAALSPTDHADHSQPPSHLGGMDLLPTHPAAGMEQWQHAVGAESRPDTGGGVLQGRAGMCYRVVSGMLQISVRYVTGQCWVHVTGWCQVYVT